MNTFVGRKLAMTSLTAEVVLTLVPRVLVIFNWGASAGAGDDSASMSIGVADMVVWRDARRATLHSGVMRRAQAVFRVGGELGERRGGAWTFRCDDLQCSRYVELHRAWGAN